MKNLFDLKIILPVLVAMVVFAWVIAPMMKPKVGTTTTNGNGNGNGNG